MSGTGRRGGFNPLIAGFITGAAAVLIIMLLVKINIDLAAPWTTTHTLTAQVANLDGISVSSDVRMAGRVIGQITAVDAQGTHSSVTFHVDDGDWPLPGDTSASIRLATLLGQKYVQLAPGSDTAHPLADGGTIPLRATTSVVDFDQVLDSFDKPTRDSITSLVRTAADAVQGQEGTLQQLIPDLRDLSVHSVTPTGELVTRNSDVNTILVNLGTTADTLNRSADALIGVIDSADSITGALAGNQAALEGFIRNTVSLNRNAGAVLGGGHDAELNAALQRLGSFATQLTTLMNDLVPETNSFVRDRSRATGQYIWQDARNVVFQIGSATSQSDRYGYFLRQAANGVDPCGLFGPSCTATNTSAAGLLSILPGSVCAPLVPCVPLSPPGKPPPVPPVPPVPPIVPGPSTGPTPTPPLPVPLPTLPLTALLQAADPLTLWGWL